MRAPRTPNVLPSLLWSGAAGLGLSLLGLLPAAAHGTANAGWIGGASHPLLGLDHLLLLLTVGVSSALAGPAVLWLAAGGAVAGALAGSFGGTLPGAEVLAAAVIAAVAAVLILHQRRQLAGGLAQPVLPVVLAMAVGIHAMLHGLESSGQPSWWLGAALASCLVVGITHLGISRLSPTLRQLIPWALVLLGSVLTIAALA